MLQTIRTLIPVLLIAIALGSSPVLAEDSSEEGIALSQGQWVFDIRIRMPMQTEPTLQRFQTCMTNDPLTASTLMPWAESQGCKIRGVKAVENTLTWKLRCNKNGQKSRGRGEFKVDGDQAEGKANVSFEMGGRRMSIVSEWDAKRIGACTVSDSALPVESDSTDSDLERQ